MTTRREFLQAAPAALLLAPPQAEPENTQHLAVTLGKIKLVLTKKCTVQHIFEVSYNGCYFGEIYCCFGTANIKKRSMSVLCQIFDEELWHSLEIVHGLELLNTISYSNSDEDHFLTNQEHDKYQLMERFFTIDHAMTAATMMLIEYECQKAGTKITDLAHELLLQKLKSNQPVSATLSLK